MAFKVKVLGGDAALKALQEASAEAAQAVQDALLVEGLSIEARAIELCPVDTGRLRASAVTRAEGRDVSVAFTAAYAEAVHENLDAHHPTGQAKFLETAVDEATPGFAARVTAAVKAALK